MNQKISNLLQELKSFLRRQYFVLILGLTTAVKLCWFERLIQINYPVLQMLIGWAFTFITVIIIFSPLLALSRFKKLVASLISLGISLVLFGDIVYFRFFQTLPTFGLLDAIQQSADVMPSITSLMAATDVLFFLDLILVLIFDRAIMSRLGEPFFGPKRQRQVYLFERLIFACVIGGVIFLTIVFEFVPKYKARLDRALAWAFETRVNAQYFGVLGGHVLDGYRFLEEKFIQISPEEKTEVLNWVRDNQNQMHQTRYTGVAKDKRVIIIQVESLGNFIIGKKVAGQEITPNLNKLLGEAHYYKNQQFVLGAGHTSDTDFVSTTSFWPLFDSSVFIRYAKDNFSGLMTEVNKAGYQSFAYHAYNRNFWNRSVAFSSLGFERFYAMESYPSGPVVNMGGLADRPFMTETFKKIAEKPAKSLSFIITLSSHFPFTTTPETQDLKINVDDYPAFAGGYLQNIHYADQAIGDLITDLKKNGMYDDTLLVIYGDHNPVMNDFQDGELKFKLNSAETKTVPFIVKLPGQKEGVAHTEPTTHLDITPTILDLLGIKSHGLMFGASVFDSSYRKQRCSDGFIVTTGKTDQCETEKSLRKDIAAKIIKYNLFADVEGQTGQ